MLINNNNKLRDLYVASWVPQHQVYFKVYEQTKPETRMKEEEEEEEEDEEEEEGGVDATWPS